MTSLTAGDCLKTGCQLVVGDQAYWGDLFEMSPSVYIFNAVCDVYGQAAPQELRGPSWHSLIARPSSVWERRGVFVIRKHVCLANPVLAKYLEEAPRG